MVEITASLVLQIVQTIALIVGIVYYITIMRNAQKAQQESENARQNELVFQKFQNITLEYARTFVEVMTMKDWDDAEEWEEKYYRTNNVEAFSKLHYIMRLYEMAGLMIRQGADPDIVFSLYPEGAVINLWEQYESVIHYMRDMWGPEFVNSFEYLYNEAKKRRPEIGR